MPVTVRLNDIQIATPCRADWDKMEVRDESGAIRHCQSCHKNVYNLSMMSRADALALIQQNESEMCVRLARRTDGTLISGDCPVGIQSKARRRRGWTIAAVVAALIPSPLSAMLKRASAATLRVVPVFSTLEKTSTGEKVFAWLDPPDPDSQIIMGAVSYMPPNPSPPSGSQP